MTTTNGRPYRVLWPRSVRERIKKLVGDAHLVGRAKDLAVALRYFDERLSREPHEVGEIYRKAGNVAEYLAAADPLSIDYAVDTARNLVIVRTAHLMGSQ